MTDATANPTPRPAPGASTARLPYTPPAIIFEGPLTTRAGSHKTPGGGHDFDVDPSKLYGNVD